MSYSNYQDANNASNQNYTEGAQSNTIRKNNSSRNIIFGLLGLLLLGGGIFGAKYISDLMGENKSKDGTIKQQTLRGDSALAVKDELQVRYDAINSKLDSMSGANKNMALQISDKDGEVARLKREIAGLMSKVRNNSASQSENSRLRSAMAELNSKVNGLEQELTKVKEENGILIAQNTQLTTERNDAVTNSTKLEGEKVVLTRKVHIASTLNASNFQMQGIDLRRNGKQKETSKAKKVDRLKVTFTLGENKVTEPGEKDLYVVIYDPSGTPLAVEALGSGRFTTDDGENKIFTKKVQTSYAGSPKAVDVIWDQEGDYTKGEYKFEVYENGFKIGSGITTLKKSGFLGL
jgi:predicted nuclease with TOPRIM domain